MGNTQINDWLMEVLSGAQSGDPQAMIITGLSGALALILVLMILIAIKGKLTYSTVFHRKNAF